MALQGGLEDAREVEERVAAEGGGEGEVPGRAGGEELRRGVVEGAEMGGIGAAGGRGGELVVGG